MADLKFAMIFEMRGLEAVRKEMEAFKTSQREMANAKATAGDAGAKAAETAKREADNVKEVARSRTIAAEQARIDSARQERDLKRRAALERATSEEARRAATARIEQTRAEITRQERDLRRRSSLERAGAESVRRERAREIATSREQARIDATRRAAEVKAAREVRLQELERRRVAQAEWVRQQSAQRTAEQERQRADERIAASIARRSGGRSQAEILREIQAQRELGRAAETAGQQATRAESRWRRLGNAMRGVRWGRVAGEAMGDLSKTIAKSVADGVGKGFRDGMTGAKSSLMNGGPRVQGAVTSAKNIGYGIVGSGISANQAGMDAENAMRRGLNEEQRRVARAAAETTTRESGNLVPLADNYAAIVALSQSGIAADKGLLAAFADTSVASNGQNPVTTLAQEYEAAIRRRDISSFAERMNADVSTGEDGKRTLGFWRDGQRVERQVTPGSEAALMRELMERDRGAASRRLATPGGLAQAAQTQFQASAATVMEEPFRVATEWMERLNKAVAGVDGGAAGLGKKIADGMRDADTAIGNMTTNITNMVGPLNQVVDKFGGWQIAAGGLAAVALAPWLTSVAAGIRGVGLASLFLASTPVGRAIVGGAGAAYLMSDIWSGKKPEAGSLQDKAQAEMKAFLKFMTPPPWNAPREAGHGLVPIPQAQGWTEPSVNQPPASASAPAGPGPQASAFSAAEQAREALSLVAQVPPAAQAMIAEVTAMLAAANFHSHGVAMMETLAAGIRAGAGAAVGAVREVTQAMRDHLPHSPAKVGPLSDLDRVRFSETLAAAIRPDPAVAAVRAVAFGMLGALPAGGALAVGTGGEVPAIAARGGGGSPIQVTYAPVLHIGAGADEGSFRAQLEAHKHELVKLLEESQARRSDLKFT